LRSSSSFFAFFAASLAAFSAAFLAFFSSCFFFLASLAASLAASFSSLEGYSLEATSASFVVSATLGSSAIV